MKCANVTWRVRKFPGRIAVKTGRMKLAAQVDESLGSLKVRGQVIFLLVLAFVTFSANAKDERNLVVHRTNHSTNEQRVALVIGNGAYTNSPLKNPVNDARDVAKKLRGLGFNVIERNNLTIKQIGSTLREFRSKLMPGAVAIVFYAGHGLQINGVNYLPAVDAEINSEEDIPYQSLAVRQIMELLDESKTRLNLVFLDACRNNPYARSFRSAESGLARVVAPSGTLISYATRPGSVAADGDGRNGLYTSKLIKQMDSHLQIELALKRVVSEVKAASKGNQEPWMEGSIEGDFCFAGCSSGESPQAGIPLQEVVPAREANYSFGSIGVVSRLAGADVWVDDNKIGETISGNEMLASNLEAGPHLVRAHKDNRTWEQTVQVSSGNKTSVSVTLESSMYSLSTALLSEVIANVEESYVTQPDMNRFLLGAMRGIANVVPSGAISISQTNDGVVLAYVTSEHIPTRVILNAPRTISDLQNEIVFGASLAREISPSLDQAKLEEAIFSAALGNLDPHSDFFSPAQHQEMMTATSGSFGGVGLTVGMKGDGLTIVSPIEGGPAERAGILPGDRIVTIDGKSTDGVKIDDAVKKMRGFPASKVTLGVMREGWTSLRDFVIVREIIRVASVHAREIESGVGYIAISQFQQETPNALQEVLDKWSSGLFGRSALQGIVLDLRNNPGGLLNGAVEVASKFLHDGQLVVTTDGRTPQSKMRLTASGKTGRIDVPMVVLVNEGTAAGAEILAGALQDSKRAVVVGNRTFGKGTIQTIIPLSGGAAVKLSTATYRTPSGRIIDGQGIDPDFLVPMSSSERAASESDVQLQQALVRLKMIMSKK